MMASWLNIVCLELGGRFMRGRTPLERNVAFR